MFNKRQNQRQKQGAFTFVEVLVAILLVALVMTALGSMMALSSRVAEANEMEQLAQLKAQQSMDFFRRERLIRGWGNFYSSLEDGTYCITDFPDKIQNMSTLKADCDSGDYADDFNFFYYNIESEITKTGSSGQQSIEVQIDIYRYTKNGDLIGTDPFFTVNQTFKQY